MRIKDVSQICRSERSEGGIFDEVGLAWSGTHVWSVSRCEGAKLYVRSGDALGCDCFKGMRGRVWIIEGDVAPKRDAAHEPHPSWVHLSCDALSRRCFSDLLFPCRFSLFRQRSGANCESSQPGEGKACHHRHDHGRIGRFPCCSCLN